MKMLWYKAWLDTRWRFVVGLTLLGCGAWLTVLGYPRVSRLLAAPPAIDSSSEVGRRLKDLVELSRGFRGYVWTQWFGQSARELGTLFAVVLGSGGVFSYGGGDLYTLSLPAPRRQLVFARAAVGVGEVLLLALAPSLLVALLAPAVGQSYSLAAALVHATCLFAASSAFFALALLLSTSYSDVWRPLLIALAAAGVVALATVGYPPFEPYSILRLMSGEAYFRTGHVPWLGLAAAAAVSAALVAGAAVNAARRDF